MKILVLGASGMLGNAVFRFLSEGADYSVFGTVRSRQAISLLPQRLQGNLVGGVDAENLDSVTKVFANVRPDVVINCIGLVKQLSSANDPLVSLPLNALFPHRLAYLCATSGARLIHISTDCVFSGTRGCYREQDPSDAQDLYGRSKYLGEVDYPHAITLRTSIIGHELNSAHGLVNWFLGQNGPVRGFKNAIFSGLPTVEVARIIRDFVMIDEELSGVHHVSSEPISKFELLKLLAQVYTKDIEILPYPSPKIDRSLDSSRFRQLTGYEPPCWSELVQQMCLFS